MAARHRLRAAHHRRRLIADHRTADQRRLAHGRVGKWWFVDLTVGGQIRHTVGGQLLLLLLLVTIVDNCVLVNRLIVFVEIAGIVRLQAVLLAFGTGDQTATVSGGDLSSQFGFLNEPVVVVIRLLGGWVLAAEWMA